MAIVKEKTPAKDTALCSPSLGSLTPLADQNKNSFWAKDYPTIVQDSHSLFKFLSVDLRIELNRVLRLNEQTKFSSIDRTDY